MVSNVPLPTPGQDRILFAIENCLLSVEAPPKEGLPHADVPSCLFYNLILNPVLQILHPVIFVFLINNLFKQFLISSYTDFFSATSAVPGCG